MPLEKHPTGKEIIEAGIDQIKFLYRFHAQHGLDRIIELSQFAIEINGVIIEGENISSHNALVV